MPLLACVLTTFRDADQHLVSLAEEDTPYAALTPLVRARIEQRLRRASDFFGQVINPFILRDLGILLDKCTALPVDSRAQLIFL